MAPSTFEAKRWHVVEQSAAAQGLPLSPEAATQLRRLINAVKTLSPRPSFRAVDRALKALVAAMADAARADGRPVLDADVLRRARAALAQEDGSGFWQRAARAEAKAARPKALPWRRDPGFGFEDVEAADPDDFLRWDDVDGGAPGPGDRRRIDRIVLDDGDTFMRERRGGGPEKGGAAEPAGLERGRLDIREAGGKEKTKKKASPFFLDDEEAPRDEGPGDGDFFAREDEPVGAVPWEEAAEAAFAEEETFAEEEAWAMADGGDGEPEPAMAAPPPSPEEAAAPAAALPPAPAADPPRTAYARLECPEAVVQGEAFDLTVGLAAAPAAGVVGGPMVRPASSVGAYRLVVQVIAEGFTLAPGASWRNEVVVSAADPYPAFTLRLTPEPQAQGVRARTLQALFSVDGQTMGMAVRAVAVLAREALRDHVAPAPADAAVDFSIPTDALPPDLTVHITLDPAAPQTLLWTFETPHRDLDLPDQALKTFVGDDAARFARQLVDKVNAREGKPGLASFLRGVGREISDVMPTVFWDLLHAADPKRDDVPTVLLLSQEPYIPWELAYVEDPLFDDAAPPFLGAQVIVGRWVLGQRRPKLPPPTRVRVDDAAVVWGVYNKPGWQRLEAAEEEARLLQQHYAAAPVNADSAAVLKCLEGDPAADLLHFALHGIYDPNSIEEGLVLVDGAYLDPLNVRGSALGRAPFVFLNACQVGSGSRVLGQYAGMAEAFLYAGASGVVAPLWSVNDTAAREIALAFYEATFSGEAPARALRRARAAFSGTSGSCLAYQFFGHPALRLQRSPQT